jgi:hypothetical protein
VTYTVRAVGRHGKCCSIVRSYLLSGGITVSGRSRLYVFFIVKTHANYLLRIYSMTLDQP